jgi:hypothetical protein
MLLGAALLIVAGTAAAPAAEPEAGHVRLDASALRLQVNDFSTRWQFKLLVAVSAPAAEQLAGVDQSILRFTNPSGRYVELLPRNAEVFPRRFKAANARLQFRATEDSASPEQSNLPAGFFDTPGPYRFSLQLLRQTYSGEFSFGEQLKMEALQASPTGEVPVRNFCMESQLPLRVVTTPPAFGPVYYKQQDPRNFVYQLANIEDSLTSESYHPPVESPSFVFQVRVGDATGAMQLLDPSRYINGHQPFLIRSDWTQTPLEFHPEDFTGHKAVLVDFIRTDTPEPNAGFYGPARAGEGWSGQLTLQNRVMYALYIDVPPTAGDLGIQAGAAAAEAE